MKNINLLVMFVLELGVLYSVGYWGFRLSVPPETAALWWFFGAPKTTFGLPGWAGVAFATGWFGLSAVALAAAGRLSWAVMVAAVTAVSKILAVIWKQ